MGGASEKRMALVGRDDPTFVEDLRRALQSRGVSARPMMISTLKFAPRTPDLTIFVGDRASDGGVAAARDLGDARGPFAVVLAPGQLAVRLEARQLGVGVVPRTDGDAPSMADALLELLSGPGSPSSVGQLVGDVSARVASETGAKLPDAVQIAPGQEGAAQELVDRFVKDLAGLALRSEPPPGGAVVDGLDWDDDPETMQHMPETFEARRTSGMGRPAKPREIGKRSTLQGMSSFPPEEVDDDVVEPAPRSAASALGSMLEDRTDRHAALTFEDETVEAPRFDDETVGAPSDYRSKFELGDGPTLDMPADELPQIPDLDDEEEDDDLADDLTVPARRPLIPGPVRPPSAQALPSPPKPPKPFARPPSPLGAARRSSVPPPASLPERPSGAPASAPDSEPPIPLVSPAPYAPTPGPQGRASTPPPPRPSSPSEPPAGSLPPPPPTAPAPPERIAPVAAPLPVIEVPASSSSSSGGGWLFGVFAVLVIGGLGLAGAAGAYWLFARPVAVTSLETDFAEPTDPTPTPEIGTLAEETPVAAVETPLEPTPTEAPVEPTPTEAPVEPTPTEAPVEPTPTEAPVEPTPTEAPTEPAPSELDPEAARAASDVHVAEARDHLRQGHRDEARAAYERALAVYDNNPRAHAALAEMALAERDPATALRHADRAASLRRRRASYQILLGDARQAAGDRPGARRAWARALDMEPNNSDAQRRLGQ